MKVFLEENGLECIGEAPDRRNPNYKVYFFERGEKLDELLEKYFAHVREWLATHKEGADKD